MVLLIMDGRSRAGKIVYPVYFHVKWKGDVVAKYLKIGMSKKVHDISFGTRVEIVHTKDVVLLLQKAIAEVRA